MARFVIDAFAWVEYLEGSEKGKKAATIIESDSNDIFTSAATIAEVLSKFLRLRKDERIALSAIESLSSVISVTSEIGKSAGKIHFEAKKTKRNFGMLDAFVAATALQVEAKILTGDDDFRGFKEAIFI